MPTVTVAIPAGAEVAETELDAIGSFVDLTANPASFDSFSVNGESVALQEDQMVRL